VFGERGLELRDSGMLVECPRDWNRKGVFDNATAEGVSSVQRSRSATRRCRAPVINQSAIAGFVICGLGASGHLLAMFTL